MEAETKWVCSLSPDRCRCSLKLVIFKLMARIDIFNISCEIALRQMPQNRTDDKLTLVQLMAWYRQATSHYLSQCWPRSVLLYGITSSRPQWVNQTIMPKGMSPWILPCCYRNRYQSHIQFNWHVLLFNKVRTAAKELYPNMRYWSGIIIHSITSNCKWMYWSRRLLINDPEKFRSRFKVKCTQKYLH